MLQAVGLLCCSFSPDSQWIVAGGNNCNVYVWQWNLPEHTRREKATAKRTPGTQVFDGS